MKKIIRLVPDTVLGQVADTLIITEVSIIALERAKVWYQVAEENNEKNSGYNIICSGSIDIENEVYSKWGLDDNYIIDKILETVKLRKVL